MTGGHPLGRSRSACGAVQREGGRTPRATADLPDLDDRAPTRSSAGAGQAPRAGRSRRDRLEGRHASAIGGRAGAAGRSTGSSCRTWCAPVPAGSRRASCTGPRRGEIALRGSIARCAAPASRSPTCWRPRAASCPRSRSSAGVWSPAITAVVDFVATTPPARSQSSAARSCLSMASTCASSGMVPRRAATSSATGAGARVLGHPAASSRGSPTRSRRPGRSSTPGPSSSADAGARPCPPRPATRSPGARRLGTVSVAFADSLRKSAN